MSYVLIAERDILRRELYKEEIRKFVDDADFHEVATGLNLLGAVIINGHYDLIVTANSLPEMAGLDAVHRIKHRNYLTPVCMVANGCREGASRMGIEFYIEEDRENIRERFGEVVREIFGRPKLRS